MEIRLAENIRAFRKARGLTQEQLAEVMGVTVGAVYKWEAKLSQPELQMIVELADFFDTSVDVLLGYAMRDNRLQATVARLKQYRSEKNREGLAEAEKALKKYPYAFDVVYGAARMYLAFGMETRDEPLLRRALELFESARLLLPQNTEPKISESTLYGDMAKVRLSLGETEQAIELLKRNNAGGMYDDIIGLTLASECEKPEEALPFLSDALMDHVAGLIQIVMGYANVYLIPGEYAQAQALLEWGVRVFEGLKDGEKPCFLDKINGVLLVCLAYAQMGLNEEGAARQTLRRARALAEAFDAQPDYRAGKIRFVMDEQASVYDDIGTTAMDGVRKTVKDAENERLTALWKEAEKNEA